jgi:hypothetical protein
VRKITGAPSHCFLGLPRSQQWLSEMDPRILAGVGDDHARSSKHNRDLGALEQRQGDRCKAAAATQTCLVNSDETPDARSRSRPCMSGSAHFLISRRAALAGLAAAAYGGPGSSTTNAEPLYDNAAPEDGAGPVFSATGPGAGLYGAAESFPVTGFWARRQGNPYHQNTGSAHSAISMKSIRRGASSAPPRHGSSNAPRSAFAIRIGGARLQLQAICRAILLPGF